jgi:hypothetical protein
VVKKINWRKEKCIIFTITADQDSAVNKDIKLISREMEMEMRIIVTAIEPLIECAWQMLSETMKKDKCGNFGRMYD